MEEQEEHQETKSSNKVAIVIIIGLIVVAFIIVVMQLTKNEDTSTIECSDDVLCCIGNRSVLYATTWCGYCKKQKEIIGEDNLDKFNIIYCDEDTTGICAEKGITSIPAWEINGEINTGLQTIEQLTEATGC